jgi:hypothetical protein
MFGIQDSGFRSQESGVRIQECPAGRYKRRILESAWLLISDSRLLNSEF